MSNRYDRLAEGLAERLAASPTRGLAFVDDERTDDPAERAEPPHLLHDAPQTGAHLHLATAPADDQQHVDPTNARPRESEPAAAADDTDVRRGHLVAASIHRRATRCKVERARRGRITWSDVLVEGVTRLVACDDIAHVLDAWTADDRPSRLVQATLPTELDRRFAELHIDLNEMSAGRTTLEQLWGAAIGLWIAPETAASTSLRNW